MAKYRANFSVNNGTCLMKSFESSNKFELWKDIKECACGELFCGSHGTCWVMDEDGRTVFEAYIEKTGNGKYHISIAVYNYQERY